VAEDDGVEPLALASHYGLANRFGSQPEHLP